MTIRRGEPWGTGAVVPEDVVMVRGDSALASIDDKVAIVLSGDVHDALGRPVVRAVGEACTLVDIDAISCTIEHLDGSVEERLVASSVEAGSWFRPRSRFVCVSNAGLVGGLNLAPRAHPNDARFDVLEISGPMTLRQRIVARRRARTGTHFPHPNVTVTQETSFVLRRESRKERLALDGAIISGWKSVEMRIVPDRWHVVV